MEVAGRNNKLLWQLQLHSCYLPLSPFGMVIDDHRPGDVVLLPLKRVFDPAATLGLSEATGRAGDTGSPSRHSPVLTPALKSHSSLDRLFAPAIIISPPFSADITPDSSLARIPEHIARVFPYPEARESPNHDGDEPGSTSAGDNVFLVRLLTHQDLVIPVARQSVVSWAAFDIAECFEGSAELHTLLNRIQDYKSSVPGCPDTTFVPPRTQCALSLSRGEILESVLRLPASERVIVLSLWERLWSAWAIAMVSA